MPRVSVYFKTVSSRVRTCTPAEACAPRALSRETGAAARKPFGFQVIKKPENTCVVHRSHPRPHLTTSHNKAGSSRLDEPDCDWNQRWKVRRPIASCMGFASRCERRFAKRSDAVGQTKANDQDSPPSGQLPVW